MSDQPFNLGPAAIADPGVSGGKAFTLSRPEWIAVQTYCTDAKALPTTNEAFKKSLGPGAPADLSDFVQLIEAYKSINDHVSFWDGTTFPATVNLASDVYDYGMNKAPVYYPAILREAEILQVNPNDQQAKDALKAILDNLKRDADQRAGKAADVTKGVQQFASDSEADQLTLVGPDGKKGLVEYYEKRYGEKSKEADELAKQIAQNAADLKKWNDEYNHDVVVAATTPTYAWVWPLGTIAAAIVAGIYGKKATDALDNAKAAQRKIDELIGKQQADANLLVAIHAAQLGIGTISGSLGKALPVIQSIQGVWGALSADLATISRKIDDDIRNVPPIIMDLGVESAIKAWYNVATNADEYRKNAYVKEQPGLASMSAWKVANQLSSRRLVPSQLVAA